MDSYPYKAGNYPSDTTRFFCHFVQMQFFHGYFLYSSFAFLLPYCIVLFFLFVFYLAHTFIRIHNDGIIKRPHLA